jgi:hypothetical protein
MEAADGAGDQSFGELIEPRLLLRILTEYGRNKPWQLESPTADSNQPNVRPDNSEDSNVADCILHTPMIHYNGLEDTREQSLNVFQLRYCLRPRFLAASGSLSRSSSHVGCQCSCRYSSYPHKLPDRTFVVDDVRGEADLCLGEQTNPPTPVDNYR